MGIGCGISGCVLSPCPLVPSPCSGWDGNRDCGCVESVWSVCWESACLCGVFGNPYLYTYIYIPLEYIYKLYK